MVLDPDPIGYSAVSKPTRITKYLGSNFLVKPLGLDLPTYIIRHMSINGNIMSFDHL